jgi:hypothetical protein
VRRKVERERGVGKRDLASNDIVRYGPIRRGEGEESFHREEE